MAQIEAEARQTIEAHARRVHQAGLVCEAVVAHGTAFQHIIDMAGDKQVDLIVMGTNGYTGLQRFLIGSVTEKVVRLAPCPVLVTRAPDAPGAGPDASSD
jgi:nucleotide-binding universal stress UspA family protein